jgi:RimJ/RimL family protein N-acetyltransferase
MCLPKPTVDIEQGEDKEIASTSPEDLVVVPLGFISIGGHGMSQPNVLDGMIAIRVLEEYTGKGYGSEAINWAVDWSFRFGNFHRISMGCFTYNLRAVKLYEKLDFVVEGRIRQSRYFDREWHDEIRLGMLGRNGWQ